jgi:uncharacterized protein YndB with AHSA1/START domain
LSRKLLTGGIGASVIVASLVVVSTLQTDGCRGNHRLTQPVGCYKVATSRLLLTEDIMGFPDRIERTLELAHPPAKVWAALTTAEGLGAWFGNEAEIDLRPGGKAWMKWDNGHRAEMRVERVEESEVFGFTWHIYGLPDDDPRRTYVEFTLEPDGAGTRLTVIESGFSQLPDDEHAVAFNGNTGGWGSELGELVGYLDAA